MKDLKKTIDDLEKKYPGYKLSVGRDLKGCTCLCHEENKHKEDAIQLCVHCL